MATPTSIREIDLAPISGKTYFEAFREWREEFIYFLLVDRFHDGESRAPVRQAARAPGIATPDDFYGGKIKGITRNLDYIAGLGCTAIWLSPVFGNNPGAYHGYNINNYLDVDPHFGSDLRSLNSSFEFLPGELKQIPVTIQNTGNTEDTYNITVTLSPATYQNDWPCTSKTLNDAVCVCEMNGEA